MEIVGGHCSSCDSVFIQLDFRVAQELGVKLGYEVGYAPLDFRQDSYHVHD